MKTAISIDDVLLKDADEVARRLGLSRSRLFTIAVGDFLMRERKAQMLRQLNDVYAGEADAEDRGVVDGIQAKVGPVVAERQ